MSTSDVPAIARLEVPRAVLVEELKRMNKVLGRSRSVDGKSKPMKVRGS